MLAALILAALPQQAWEIADYPLPEFQGLPESVRMLTAGGRLVLIDPPWVHALDAPVAAQAVGSGWRNWPLPPGPLGRDPLRDRTRTHPTALQQFQNAAARRMRQGFEDGVHVGSKSLGICLIS